MMWLAIFVFIVILLVLVLVHEFGHFIVAKRAGCRVEEFGFGFPPKLFSIKRGETEYSFNLLPLGGFVRIEGEDMDNPQPGPQSFASKSALARIAILAAGVAMNILLAYVLLTVQSAVGMPVALTEDNSSKLSGHQTYITEIAPGSPAAQSGLKALDRIVRIGDIDTPSISDVQRSVSASLGKEITMTIDRQGVKETISLTPRANPPANEGALGIAMTATGLTKYPWWTAPWHGLVRTYEMFVAIIVQFGVILKNLFIGNGVGSSVTGPIGIAVYTNEVTKLGIGYILEFAALISLNLAIINILPFPALDGGRIMFVLLEKIRGRRLSTQVEHWAHTAGFALLILLMLLITFRDIKKFFL